VQLFGFISDVGVGELGMDEDSLRGRREVRIRLVGWWGDGKSPSFTRPSSPPLHRYIRAF
jgi:hypothetical protein